MARDHVKDLHVAIVGAGIGGLALAMALHRKGVPFTLYEEAEQYSAVGAGIGFGPNGLQALDMIEAGFRPKYEAICVGNKPADAQHVFFECLLLEGGLGLKEQWYRNSSFGHPNYTRKSAHRKELLDILTSFIPIERVKFSKRLTQIRQFRDKVVLTFADGEVVQTSILVGADGIQSNVRQHVLGTLNPSQVQPVYAGSYCYRGVIPIADAKDILGSLTDVAKMYFGNNRCCVTYLISGGEEFNFLHCVSDSDRPWDQKNAVTEKVTHEAMMADFQGRDVDERLLRLLSKAEPIRWGLFHHQTTETYHLGRVCLLGDSAHASLPFQAAGAAQGVEDALVLSNLLVEIAHAPDQEAALGPYIHAAFVGYDSVRRPRAQKQLEQSAEVALMLYFQHPDAGSDMTKIMPKLQLGRYNWIWFHDLKDDIRAASQRMNQVMRTSRL